MEIKNRGFVIIISSPSGCGKTTVVKELLKYDANLELSISATTRKPREGEVDGRDYFFLNVEKFQELIKENYFLEYAEVFGRYYGTPKSFVEDKLNNGINLVFDIDWQGVVQLKQTIKDDIVTIFMLPPSIDELKKRLMSRNLDDLAEIDMRVREAGLEISKHNEYDYVLINDNLEKTILQIKSIIIAEKCKRDSGVVFEVFERNSKNTDKVI